MTSIYQKLAVVTFGVTVCFTPIESNIAQAALLGSPIRLSEQLNSNNAVNPSLVYNSTEQEYLAAWSFSTTGSRVVALQNFSSTGVLNGENIRLPQGLGIDTDPVIAYNSIDNQYLVSFQVQGDPLFPFNSSVVNF